VINTNLGPISYRFRDTAFIAFNPFIKNCGQTAADGDIITIDSISLSNGTIADPLITYCLATIPHD